MEEVMVVYQSDAWISKDKLRVKAVCTEWQYVLMVVENILRERRIKYREDIPEDEEETSSIEDYLEEFERDEQIRCDDFSITFDTFKLNYLPYSL